MTNQNRVIDELKAVLAEKASGGGNTTIYYAQSGACYVQHMVIEPSNGVYTKVNMTNMYQDSLELKSVEMPNIVITTGMTSVFARCSKLKRAILPKVTYLSHYWFSNCTALEEVQLGSIGYPVTSIALYTFSNVTQEGLIITVYVDAESLADIIANVANNSPWGAKNATIVYRNSTTGEVITE